MVDIAQAIGVCDIALTSAYCSIIPDFSQGVRTYICILVKFWSPCILLEDFVSSVVHVRLSEAIFFLIGFIY